MKLRVFVILLSVVFVVLVVGAAAVPIVTVAYTENEPYSVTETYYVQEAYTEQEDYYEKEPFTKEEAYTESEPYNRSVPLNCVVTDKEGYNYFWSTGFDARVWIKNSDTQGGWFSVVFYCVLQGGATTTRTVSEYIAPGDTELVELKYSGAYLSQFDYSMTPPTKTVLDYREVAKTRYVTEFIDVLKTREVTKYRDVPRERTVVKVRPVTRHKKVTLFQSWFGE